MENAREFKKIEIGDETLKNLNTTRKWTMFLAVSGFIFLGLIISLGLITGTFLTAFNISDKTYEIPDLLLISVFVILALVNLFPVLFLFRFSRHASDAVKNHDANELYRALKYLKRFFVYIGVLLITIIVIYIASLVLSDTLYVLLNDLL